MPTRFPYSVTGAGRTAQDGYEQHVRGLIEQVLFTSPGERVNRPDLGTRLQHFVFAGQDDATVATVEFLVRGALQEWLGDLIEVEGIDVANEDASLVIRVRYRLVETQQWQSADFRPSGTGASEVQFR